MMLGDLLILGEPPAKLIKALAVIAQALHPTLSKNRYIAGPDKSKESCIISSAVVRDFLIRIGFADARIAPCFFVMFGERDGAFIHSLGIGRADGMNTDQRRPGYWEGHVVVTVPSAGYLIDATQYPSRRPAWAEWPGMIAAPLRKQPPANLMYGMTPLASHSMQSTDDGTIIDFSWLDQPRDDWRTAPDYSRTFWRKSTVAELVKLFGEWRG